MFSNFKDIFVKRIISTNPNTDACFFPLIRWIGSWIFFALFSCIKAQQPSFHHFTQSDGLPSNNIYDVMIDRNDFLWFSSDKGISRFDGVTFRNYTMANGLPDNEVFSLFEDHVGRIWFGTYNGIPGFIFNGVIYNPKNAAPLRNIHLNNYISAIAEDNNGNIFLGLYPA